MTKNRRPRIVIAGGGPAGSSLAIRLAQSGVETILIERERFPRQKLCGEFISPECLRHFRELGIEETMLDAGGDRIFETHFFETGGRGTIVPSGWFGQGEFALSLSRAEMDHQLLERAKAVGVEVREGAAVTKIEKHGDRISKVSARSDDGGNIEIEADGFVDATGRGGVLARLAEKRNGSNTQKPAFVGFKAHITGAAIPRGRCEIYSFPGGYAGLCLVENDRANLCFLIKSATVRSTVGGADEIVRHVLVRNQRAKGTLSDLSTDENGWLAVSIASFGTKSPAPLSNLFTVGDAASFIDPFTGSGMVMALESSELLARSIVANAGSPERIRAEYLSTYSEKFASRLRICSLLRRTAFMPRLATTVVSLLGVSSSARRLLARATRR